MKTNSNTISKTTLISVSRYINRNGKLSWFDAMDFASRCNMRIPTRSESLLIVENKSKFTFELPEIWWTSETRSYETAEAWSITDNGLVSWAPMETENPILLVNDLTKEDQNNQMEAADMVAKLRELGYTVKCTKTTTIEL